MKNYKLFLTTLGFALMIVFLSSSVFAGTIEYTYVNDDPTAIQVFFDKPDSWKNSDVYVNFVNSVTGELAFDEPGQKMMKVLDKFSFDPVMEFPNDLYAFPISSTPLTENNFDRVVFSSGASTTSISDKTVPAELIEFARYTVTDGEELSQTVTSGKVLNVTIPTSIQRFATDLRQKNPELYQTLEETINSLIFRLQQIVAEEYDVNEINAAMDSINTIKDTFVKDPNSTKELEEKIAEANEKITEEGYTEESISALEDEIPNAQNIVDNETYFSQDQIDAETENLDNLIKGLVPVTTDLEKAIEEAKAIDPEKYTDETAKALDEAVKAGQECIDNKTAYTPDQVKELTKNIKDAMAALEEKKIATETKNPATGDILAIILPILALASVAGIFTFVYSKKRK